VRILIGLRAGKAAGAKRETEMKKFIIHGGSSVRPVQYDETGKLTEPSFTLAQLKKIARVNQYDVIVDTRHGSATMSHAEEDGRVRTYRTGEKIPE
jgi:hypothetical protein